MTKEELEKEAEDNKPPYAFCAFDTNCELWKDGFQKGAEPREKRIAELEAQIEQMKCCGNCIHCKYDENEESYEFCEKHQQVVNIAVVPCSEWKRR